MTSQTEFANTHAHSSDIDTSRDAARSARDMARRHKALVFAALKQAGPRTSEELSKIVGLDVLQVMKRVSDLRIENAVVDTGDRRLTKTGRNAAVWQIAMRDA